jgi:hypothetical protein
MLRSLALVACSVLASGCADKPGTAASTIGEAAAAANTPYTPRAALPTIEVSAAPTSCPAVPTLDAAATEAQRRLSPYAAALRRLACEPTLYTKTTAALVAELGLPAEAAVGFDGPRTASLTLPTGVTVGDLAVALGVAAPQVKVTWQAYHDITRLGTDPTSGDFDLYSPGTIRLDVDFEVDRYGPDAGKERVIAAPPDAAVGRSVQVAMSAEAVKIVGDDDAVPLVVSALEQLDASPELLALKPDEARPRIGLGDERYRVAETSIHGGAAIRRGLSINPRRTVLPAAALAAALGLADARATNVNREHDVWELEAGGTTQIRWRGLELSISVDVDVGDGPSVALDGLEVSFMTVFPAKP